MALRNDPGVLILLVGLIVLSAGYFLHQPSEKRTMVCDGSGTMEIGCNGDVDHIQITKDGHEESVPVMLTGGSLSFVGLVLIGRLD